MRPACKWERRSFGKPPFKWFLCLEVLVTRYQRQWRRRIVPAPIVLSRMLRGTSALLCEPLRARTDDGRSFVVNCFVVRPDSCGAGPILGETLVDTFSMLCTQMCISVVNLIRASFRFFKHTYLIRAPIRASFRFF